MSETAKRNSAEMRYLLRDLSEDEKARMEEAFFADDAKFEELELAEEELIDAYVRKQLSPEEQRRFEARLLRSPRLVERVNFARVLAERADSELSPEAEDPIDPAPLIISSAPEPRRKWWEGLYAQQPAFRAVLAACVILMVGGGGLFYGWLGLRNESERLASERAVLQKQKEEFERISSEQRARVEQQAAEQKQEREQQTQDQRKIEDQQPSQLHKEPGEPLLDSVVVAVLTPGSQRSGGGGNEVGIGPNISTVKLSVPLDPNDYQSYRVIVKNIDDGRIPFQGTLKAQNTKSGPQLIFTIPVRRLPPGDYTINVTGHNPPEAWVPVNDYSLRVKKQ